MEFKGTKGKWEFEIDEYHQHAIVHSITVGNGVICEINYTDSNMSQVPYDFNLMAHSKDMLKMLSDIKDLIEAYPSEAELHMKGIEIRELIKSATEVNND